MAAASAKSRKKRKSKAKSDPVPESRGAPGLVLFARAEPALATLLATQVCACAVLDITDQDDAAMADLIADYRSQTEAVGTALLSLDNPDRAKTLGLDGVHLTQRDHAVRTARERLGGQSNIGCGPAPDRHLAMMLGEQEPDYVLLAGKDSVDGTLVWTTPEADLVTWWAELFEVPSVAFCHTVDEAIAMAAAGADFIGFGNAFCAQPDATRQLVSLTDQLTALAAQETPES
jgi:thiamine-phosphate pyrophosphorylase